MKIAITITDTSHVVHAGGDVERRTSIIEVPDESLPKLVRDYMEAKARENPKEGKWCYQTAALSLVEL